MKYMTFNSSCSYAGLANLLFFHGIETEDREIALQMELPYLFDYEDGRYCSGPMLQGAKWFNLYLRPRGFLFSECRIDREDVCTDLQSSGPAMLGLRVSPESKHAVIYTDYKNGCFHFLNNKREDSPEPDTLSLTEGDLLSRLDESVTVGRLERAAPVRVDFRPYLEHSVRVLQGMQQNLSAFCGQMQSVDALREAMNLLFRPVLLDGVTMLELLGETVGPLKDVQAQFLTVVRAGRPAILAEKLDMAKLDAALEKYQNLIMNHMETK